MTEAEIMKKVLRRLENLTMTGDIVWYSRLNSGKINVGRAWVQLCKAGTPDIIAIVKCDNGKIATLFIECKRAGVKKLSYEQRVFFENMENKPMVLCKLINNPEQLWPAIREASGL